MEVKEQRKNEVDLFKEFMEIMGQNDMKEQSQDVMKAFQYVAGMQVQLAIMVDELQGVREQLAQLQESQPQSVGYKALENVARLEGKIAHLSEWMEEVKDNLIKMMAQAVSAFREKGKQEMNKIIQKGISGIKSMLEIYRDKTVDVLTDYEKTANQIDSIGDELKLAGNSIANVGRLLSGKGAENISDEKQGIILTRVINKPVKKHIEKLRAKLDQIDGIFEKLDSFSIKLEQKKKEVKKERVSVKEKLSDMKAKTNKQRKHSEQTKSKEECL